MTIHESGAGEPVVFVHGSGMSGAKPGRRCWPSCPTAARCCSTCRASAAATPTTGTPVVRCAGTPSPSSSSLCSTRSGSSARRSWAHRSAPCGRSASRSSARNACAPWSPSACRPSRCPGCGRTRSSRLLTHAGNRSAAVALNHAASAEDRARHSQGHGGALGLSARLDLEPRTRTRARLRLGMASARLQGGDAMRSHLALAMRAGGRLCPARRTSSTTPSCARSPCPSS